MISKEEAYKRSRNAKLVERGKQYIESSIAQAVEEGKYSIMVDCFKVDMTDEAFDILSEWVESYGYKVEREQFTDAPSGWLITEMVISWEEEEVNK